LSGKSAKQTFNEVPKIDFRRIYSNTLKDRKELAKEVGAACRDVGFFYAVNHGVDDEMLNDTFDALKEYFALPEVVKMETHNQKTEKFRGYEAFLEGKLDPSTRGGKAHPSLTWTSQPLILSRSQRRLPHGRRRHGPGAKPPHYSSPSRTP
jgi:isopenicillin N synthase-like dioxygenase